MTLRIKMLSLVLPLALGPVQAALYSQSGSATLLPDGTPVHLVLMDNLQDQKAKVGDAVRFKVREDVVVDHRHLILTGTIATGHVTKISKSGLFGKSGNIGLRIDSVASVSGTSIRLSGGTGFVGGKGGALTATSAMWFGPDASMAVGTMMNAVVDGDQPVTPVSGN